MKLFTWFAAAGFHTSIVSTFGLDFDAYEAIVLPRLRDAGCNNNIVLADARMLVQALSEEARRPKFAGRRYSVVGAHSAGVFHPKVILQLGKASGRLLVGSANMTAAGVAGNLEVVGEVAVADDDMAAAPLLRAALDYLLKFTEPGTVARRQVEWALKRTRWLPAAASAEAVVALQEGMRVAFLPRNDEKGIAERFVEFVGDRSVQRLVVASPYWDHDLRALLALQGRFGASAAVLIQPQARLYPVHAHPRSGALELFDVCRIPGAANRFAHAKLFVAETVSGDCVMFGSANCTEAALGTSFRAGVNEEACLARDLPAGEAVRMLGLAGALAAGEELDAADVPSFVPIDDIALSELAARLPGRFELSGDLLRWWRPRGLEPGAASIQLLDQNAEPIAARLTRVGTQSLPASYHFDGAVVPHFAQVRWSEFASSLAVVGVEQAIQQTQRRAVGRGVESALELLDDDEASEGLWLLEVIQRLTEAEREMRAHRGVAEQPPPQGAAHEAAPDPRVLSYEEFVAGRRAEGELAVSSASHLAWTQHESVRSFLNALIGKRAAQDLEEAAEADAPVPNLGMGDETSDGAAAVESDDLPTSSPNGPIASSPEKSKQQLQKQQRYVEDSQRSIVDGVEAFLKTLRDQTSTLALGVVDMLRLRALLVVVLGAGSKRADLRPKDLNAQVRRRQVLPSRGDASWRGRVGRILYEFFRDNSTVRPPLVKSLRLEADDSQGLPEDVLECWVTCFWAICAMRVATDDSGASFEVTPRDSALAADLYRFCYRLPQQVLDPAVRMVFAGMSSRYGERLGVDPGRVEAEHRALVATIRT
jgi:hypothetical protein